MADNTSLSAKDAADRVSKRRGVRERPDEQGMPYLCENCLSHEFIFYQNFDQQRTISDTLDCDCGEHEIAASREYVETHTVTDGGPLGENHRVGWGEGDIETIVESEDREETEFDIECSSCLESADPDRWRTDDVEGWEDLDSWEFCEVRCGDCGHEIEFGWSHPERGWSNLSL